ncbi:MAG: chorismate-binding protein [Deltaproteobacteria bacterium]|nr:chorismate-binding protein [Deltaproteobacteria bacterium]
MPLLTDGDRLRPDPAQLARVDAWLSGLQAHCDAVAVAGFPQRDAHGQLCVPLRAWLPRLWLTSGEPLAVAVVLDKRSDVDALLDEIRSLLGGLRPALACDARVSGPAEPVGPPAPVAAALDRLHRPGLDKLVVAAAWQWHAPLRPQAVEARLFAQQTGAWICSFSAALLGRGAHQVVCASPELLVRTQGEHVATLALAGTLAPDETVADHLVREHQLVVDYLDGALQDLGIDVEIGVRQLREAGPLFHLATPLQGHRPPGLDALVAALHLHPTPALLGLPRAPAALALAELEAEPRGWYGGFAGVVSAAGDGEGEFAVLLRGAEWLDPHWRSWAGAGLVAGSTAADELAEIGHKHQAIGHMFGLAGAL